MRRKDREMNRAFALKVIDKSVYGVLSMSKDGGEPYAVPLSIVRDGEILYFHSAKKGEKIKTILDNPQVCVTFVGETMVSDNLSPEELEELGTNGPKAASIINEIFTIEYESAIVKGKASLVSDNNEKIQALKLICEKYTPDKMDYFLLAIRASLKITNVYKITLEEITGKKAVTAGRSFCNTSPPAL